MAHGIDNIEDPLYTSQNHIAVLILTVQLVVVFYPLLIGKY